MASESRRPAVPVVNVSLAFSEDSAATSTASYSLTVSKCNENNELLRASELARSLLEDDGFEDWLLPVCAQVRPSLRGAVLLHYTIGDETLVLMNGAESNEVALTLRVGLCVVPAGEDPMASHVTDMFHRELPYNRVMAFLQNQDTQPALYIRTRAQGSSSPADEGGERRIIRVWSAHDDPYRVGRIERETRNPAVVAASIAAIEDDISVAAAPPAASRAAKPGATKKRNAKPAPAHEEANDNDDAKVGDKTPVAKNKAKATKPATTSKLPPQPSEDIVLGVDGGEKPIAQEKKKKKRKHNKRDPNAPKKPLNAYTFYIKARRARLKETKPDLGPHEITNELVSMWKKLSSEDKKEWEEKAEIDKKRYDREMENYSPPEGAPESGDDETESESEIDSQKDKKKRSVEKGKELDASPKKKRGKKRKKDPNAPKKPSSAYLIFSNAHRSVYQTDHPNLSAQEVMKGLSSMWNEVSDEGKKKWQEQADMDKERYKKEMESYSAQVLHKSGGEKEDEDKKPAAKKAKAGQAERTKPVIENRVSESARTGDDETESEDERDESENRTNEQSVEKETQPDASIKKKRKKKDPNAPKRPLSGYLIFSNEHREVLKNNNPDLGSKDIVKKIAAMWNDVSPEGKKKWEEKASGGRQKYAEEKQKYLASKQPEEKEGEADA